MTRMILILMMIRESMLNGAPLCDIKKRDKILKKFMMVKNSRLSAHSFPFVQTRGRQEGD